MDQALDDVLGLLHEIEADLLEFDAVSGDPNYCELLINKVQVPIAFLYDTSRRSLRLCVIGCCLCI